MGELHLPKRNYNATVNYGEAATPQHQSFKSELSWWSIFLPAWNRVGIISSMIRSTVMLTRAGEWLMLEWPHAWKSIHITVKELLPIVMGVALWGKQWQGGSVVCCCDNAAVVAILKSGWCKDNLGVHLLQSLFFWLAMDQVAILSEHILGLLTDQQMHYPKITSHTLCPRSPVPVSNQHKSLKS